MLLVAAMDEGPLIGYGEHPLSHNITTPELTRQLISLSRTLLQQHLPRHLSGETKEIPQSFTGRAVSYSRKLTKEDGIINWAKPAEQIEREVRAFIEWPKSRTTFGKLDVVITKAHVIAASGQPGSTTILEKQPVVYCRHQALVLDEVKPAGKPAMAGSAFLAGYRQQFLSTP